MKNVQKIVMVIVLIAGTMLASGQSNTDIKQILSNPVTRKTVMDAIVNDSIMAKEMMTTMMNSPNHMKMMKNHESMMKDNPGMKHSKMDQMMESCKGDTAMMKCKAMMESCKGDTAMMKCKAMMESCKGDTAMMKQKCKAMMEECKGDTAMMKQKCKAMMEEQEGKEMMHQRMKESEETKNLEGVDKTKLEVIKPKK